MRRSLTSTANSGEREAMTYSNRVFCDVMPLVLNWASTCANQTVGSVGQNGGSLMLTAATVREGPGATTEVLDSPVRSAGTVSIVASAGVDIVEVVAAVEREASARRSVRGHQCSSL